MKDVFSLVSGDNIASVSSVVNKGVIALSSLEEIVSFTTDEGIVPLAGQKNVVRGSALGKTYGLQGLEVDLVTVGSGNCPCSVKGG